MTKRQLFFGIPAANRQVDTSTVLTVFHCIGSMRSSGITDICVEFATGNNGVHMARNFLVARFLESGYSDLFFLDADIACQPGGIERMMRHDVDVVLGLYRTKTIQEFYTYQTDPELPFERNPETGLIPILGGPAGFMRITRNAIDRMLAHYCPKEEPGKWVAEIQAPQYGIPQLFHFRNRGGQMYGEDLGFCWDYKAIGGQVWLDPDHMLFHTGTMTFASNFWESFMSKRQALVHNDGKLEIHTQTPEDLARQLVMDHDRRAAEARP